MKRIQIVILAVLSFIALAIFSAIGLLLVTSSSPVPETKEAVIEVEKPVETVDAVAVLPTPEPTRPKLELPTAAVVEPTSLPTAVVIPDSPAAEPAERQSLTEALTQHIEENKPEPTPVPTPIPPQPEAPPAKAPLSLSNGSPEGEPVEGLVEPSAPLSSGLQPTFSSSEQPQDPTSLPSGEWEYFASSSWGTTRTYMNARIEPEDAQAGRISVIGAQYGLSTNSCDAYFFDVPVEYKDGELKFHQYNEYGSVFGSYDAKTDQISALIDDFTCTGDAFGMLDRLE